MKKCVAVVSEDIILYNKIRLLLRGCAEVIRLSHTDTSKSYDAVFHDMRINETHTERAILIGEGGDLPLCFLHEDLLSLFESSIKVEKRDLVLGNDTRHVTLFGKQIKLTELEYKLLEYLYESKDFVTRSELLDKIWDGKHDEGVVNVYVHYLRQKLEADGNKLIISSRKYGYKLDEKYKKGE